MDCSPPDPLSMGSCKQEYWSGFSFPLPWDLLHPGIELCFLCLLHWQTCSLLLVPPGKPNHSIKFHHSVVSNSLWPHEPQHARLPYHQLLELAQTHGYQISDAIQPSHPLLSLLLPSIFPSIRVFFNESVLPIRGQSIGVSGSASVLPMNIQDWFPLGLTGLISLKSKGLSRVFSSTTI